MRTKKSKAVVPTRREKWLEKELAEKTRLCAMAVAERNLALDRNVYLDKNLSERAFRAQELGADLERITKERNDLAEGTYVAAQTLQLERDELLVRARRLEFRIKGLGFKVQ